MSTGRHELRDIGEFLASRWGFNTDADMEAFIKSKWTDPSVNDSFPVTCMLSALVSTNKRIVKQLDSLPEKIAKAVAAGLALAEVNVNKSRKKAAKAELEAKLANPTITVLQVPDRVIEKLQSNRRISRRY